MKIRFLGAAQTTTGSMHLVEAAGRRILLDCGLYQGKRKEAFERNRNLPFDATTIDAVVLSHAHQDHSGNLPTLVKRGFRGAIWCTPATRDLCDIMLRDSANLQERDVAYVNKRRVQQGQTPFEPLYGAMDIDPTLERMRALPHGRAQELAPGLRLTLNEAGHILGSATVTLDVDDPGAPGGRIRLLFTGDLGQAGVPILRAAVPVPGVDVYITESTYGSRLHPDVADVKGRLKGFIEDIAQQRSKLIIPAFSVGRTQQILYYLNELYEARRIPAVPVYVDSPLSVKATQVYEKHRECYNAESLQKWMQGDQPFQFRSLRYVTGVEESKALNGAAGPAVILSSSGMCEGGRILHHLKHTVGDPRNIILIVGFQAEHTLGRRLVEHANPVKIFGEEMTVEARVHTINALSAHADRQGLLAFYESLGTPPRRVFAVHGELEACMALAQGLKERGAPEVLVPREGQVVDV
jgi:metallo-beta-lactamase family protein